MISGSRLESITRIQQTLNAPETAGVNGRAGAAAAAKPPAPKRAAAAAGAAGAKDGRVQSYGDHEDSVYSAPPAAPVL